jgi:hypothetical protein
MNRFPRSVKRLVIIIAANVLVLGFLLVLIEGAATYGLFLRDMHDVPKTKPHARQFYAKYDANLGWVNIPNTDLPNVYGPGGYVKINSQGFRSDHEIENAVPNGKRRIVCSGDSYTFGYGVDNAHSWCQLLATLEPRIEAVNMGGDGYGVDQAYLRYKRSAAAIDHQIHFFAFITDDFYRMLADSFLGYAKPRLEIEDGNIVVKNTPVPVTDSDAPYLAKFFEEAKSLRTFELIKRFRRKIDNSTAAQPSAARALSLTQAERDQKARELLRHIFADLKIISQERYNRLVLVYLPTIWELENRPLTGWSPYQEWIEFLTEESKKRDLPFINVFEKFESLDHAQMVAMFIPQDKLPYPEGSFHLNERGNETVAKVIYDRVLNDPLISYPLADRQAPTSQHRLSRNGALTADHP